MDPNGKNRSYSTMTAESDVSPGLNEPKTPERLQMDKKLRGKIKEPALKYYPTYAFFCDNPEDFADPTKLKGFKTARVSHWLAENEHFKNDRKTDMFYYGDEEKGVWKLNGETELREIVTKIMGDNDTKYHFSNILHTLKGLTTRDIEFSNKVSLENGLFDLETKELTKQTLNEMPFFKYPVTYDPEANDLGDWLTYLNEVAKPEDIPLLQEWMGYCLYPDYRIHAALFIYGKGRNGKGVYDRTILGLVGKDNATHVSLAEINVRFSLKEFYGKIYHSSSEPPTHKPFRTETFQRLTGGDMIDAEFKGKNERVKFVNRAKMTIIGNNFPKILNPTIAFKDRVKFVEFSKFIEKENRVPYLENIWLNDPKKKSALFNWALEGLHRLLSNGVFTESKTQEETEIEFQRASDTPNAFIAEMGIIDRNLVTTRSDARRFYEEYCDANGLDLSTKSEFTKAMQGLAPKVKDGSTRISGKKERAWLGFGVKDLEQMEQMEQQNIPTKTQTHLILKENENSVPSVPSVPKSEKPILNVYRVINGEPCSCGKFAVTMELHDTVEKTRKGYCDSCGKAEKKRFFDNGYQFVYPSSAEAA